MSRPLDSATSWSTALRRSSNSPCSLAPAMSAPMSRLMMRHPMSDVGTSPDTMRCARPSTMAVLPTPGSPMSTGLFLVRRDSTLTTREISSSRPITGSSLPSMACCTTSVAYCAMTLSSSPAGPSPPPPAGVRCLAAVRILAAASLTLSSVIPALARKDDTSLSPTMAMSSWSTLMSESPTAAESACARAMSRLSEELGTTDCGCCCSLGRLLSTATVSARPVAMSPPEA
mmetsp:Transcript_19242/g.48689  ORF Transcript_19242/g.48689 Transcript_19242/m.48689 type:complete len:230 (-) Transcript_19242:857-1546(-)